VFALWATKRKRTSHQAGLARALGVAEGGTLAVTRYGRSFTARYTPSSKNTPATVRITTPLEATGKTDPFGEHRVFAHDQVDVRPYIVLRRETAIDRFGKRHGLNREIEVGDAAFDAAVYIETSSLEANVRRTLTSATLRKAVAELLDSGVRRVVLDPTGLYAERAVRAREEPGDGIDRDMALLADVAAALPAFKAGQADKPHWRFEIIVFVAAVIFTIMLLPFRVPAPLGDSVLYAGIGGGLALWALAMTGVVRFLRGRSDSLRRIGAVFIATLGLLPWGTYEALCGANRTLDPSPAIGHPTSIVRVWTSRSKSNTYFHVDVASWRPDEAIVSLNVSSAFAQRAAVGRKIVVTTHAGKFGWEWVDTFRLI